MAGVSPLASGAPLRHLGSAPNAVRARAGLRGYLRRLQERQNVLVAELQHRTRNLIGVVRATADTTLRSSGNLDELASEFRDRLGALARVQGLLSRLGEGDRLPFDDLLR